MKVYFLSSNLNKIKEVENILNSKSLIIEAVEIRIKEIQSEDIYEIADDKVLTAFNQIGRPIFVEQTGLYLDDLNGFPGGLTQIFWDKLKHDKFCSYFGHTENSKVTAKTVIAYCDGTKIYNFEGEISGKIAPSPRGCREFEWDAVFIPDGYKLTFAEMGPQKNKISMRKKAIEEFRQFLEDKNDK